eukprot:TRINITY_DN841_c0_g1_i1.p1 TRINITY_DN841_c0_g1~~TRINITY_DN841_c0_g1_i1.p1  ORF type:complete len:363 (-),score=99.03 TRINITY_DN841_c0_g1_i1:69-1157(-)
MPEEDRAAAMQRVLAHLEDLDTDMLLSVEAFIEGKKAAQAMGASMPPLPPSRQGSGTGELETTIDPGAAKSAPPIADAASQRGSRPASKQQSATGSGQGSRVGSKAMQEAAGSLPGSRRVSKPEQEAAGSLPGSRRVSRPEQEAAGSIPGSRRVSKAEQEALAEQLNAVAAAAGQEDLRLGSKQEEMGSRRPSKLDFSRLGSKQDTGGGIGSRLGSKADPAPPAAAAAAPPAAEPAELMAPPSPVLPQPVATSQLPLELSMKKTGNKEDVKALLLHLSGMSQVTPAAFAGTHVEDDDEVPENAVEELHNITAKLAHVAHAKEEPLSPLSDRPATADVIPEEESERLKEDMLRERLTAIARAH